MDERLRAVRVILLAVLAIVFGTAFPAPAKDSITWMQVNMPPFFIHEGLERHRGYGDVVSAILQANLPNYDHHVMVTNVIRHFERFKQGEKVCSIGLYRTPEREQFIAFSIPSFLTLPAALVTTKDKAAAHGWTGSVRLDDVLHHPEFVLGLSADRSYGLRIDTLLKQHHDRFNLITYSGQELAANYFKMLLLDRLDGLLALPDEAMYQAKRLGIGDRLTVLSIEENQEGYEGWMCAVGCPNNEWGRGVIEQVNRILVEQRPTEQYKMAYERWLDPGSADRYRTLYRDVFLTTVPPGR